MGSIKHINDFILNSQKSLKFLASTKCLKSWYLGNYFPSFAQEILFDKGGHEVMGTGSALCCKKNCVLNTGEAKPPERKPSVSFWIEKG